ncbi:MAG: hypothetical protein H6965_03105 [Chromatiaceae bacterium]|nr:hypothetical protein [Chromatiaceae bacterium]
MDISFKRGPEISRETRALPADHYRLIRLLFHRNKRDSLFVPIRSMQYLGIIDREEVVFVDGLGIRVIELAWRDFKPGERDDLQVPVSYTCIHYRSGRREILPRLQSEFFKALKLLEQRQPSTGGGSVTHLRHLGSE